jgi:hypothetical protein
VPPVPPGFGTQTAAQQALAELLQVPQELLVATARHSNAAVSSTGDDFAAWVKLLPPERRNEYLVRLARNEPGLSRLLVRELRELGQDKTRATPSTGEHVTYATLLAESKGVKAQLEHEKREQERVARQLHLQDIHNHQDDYWHQVDQAAMRTTGTGYDEAVRLLIELRGAADQFKETREFQERFRAWVLPHLRRPAARGLCWPMTVGRQKDQSMERSSRATTRVARLEDENRLSIACASKVQRRQNTEFATALSYCHLGTVLG